MILFDQYECIKGMLPDFPELKGIQSCTGFSNLEEMIQKMRTTQLPIVIVEDAPDMSPDISDSPNTDQHFMMYVIYKGSLTDRSKRHKAYTDAYNSGMAILKSIKSMYRGTKAFPDGITVSMGSSLNEKTINTVRVGPLPHNGYGYGFMYSIKAK